MWELTNEKVVLDFTSKMLGFNQPYLGKLPTEFGMLPAICVILPAKQGKATEKIPKRKI